MKIRKIIFVCLLTFSTCIINAQQDTLRVVSYNVENLFDCTHDSLKNDYEFLPDSKRRWTPDKYKQKQANIAKVISAIGGWNTPALVGLIEVENRKTLIALTRFSPLKNLDYKFIHQESPDSRGIDVALLYQARKFKPLHTEFIQIKNPKHPHSHTREILYCAGKLKNGDTLHVFVNHFPSRLGGQEKSEQKREFAAQKLRHKVDSIYKITPQAHILIMGDFNDYPSNRSMSEVLKAKKIETNSQYSNLYNLYYQFDEKGEIGSNKYQGEWGMLDQIIVSGALLKKENSIYTDSNKAAIFNADFLLKTNERSLEIEPFRTYKGMKYLAGYSDHLPVYIDIIVRTK